MTETEQSGWLQVGKRALEMIETQTFDRLIRRPLASLENDEWGFIKGVMAKRAEQP